MERDHPNFYIDEKGLFILKESFLINRGYCCGNGCIHCPYDPCQKGSKTLKKTSDKEKTS